jgi:hypothetical protein
LLAAQSRLSGNDTNPTLPTVVHLAIALAVIVLTEASIDVAMLKPVWIAGWAALAMIAAGVLRSRGFAETGYGILFGGYLYFLSVDLASASIRASGSVHPSFESWWAGALVALVPLLIGIGVDRHTTLEASEEGTAGPEGGTPGSQEGTAGGKDPEAPHGDTGPPSRFRGLAPPFAPSLLGLLLLGVYANAQLPAGFGYLVPAVVSLLLLHLADAFPARRLVIAAVAAVGALHIFFLSEGYIGTNIETAGIALLLFVVATLAVERGAQPRMSENPADTAVATPALMALVVLATATSMTAIYLWVFVGPTWATAGWSVVGGSILAAGFVFRASIYRRVGLVVLGVCIVRVFAVDTVGLSDTARIGAFLVLGLILVGIALLYTRYTAELKEWL